MNPLDFTHLVEFMYNFKSDYQQRYYFEDKEFKKIPVDFE